MTHHAFRQAQLRFAAMFFTALILSLAGTGLAGAAICRVTTAGNGSNDGSTWALSMDLQTALTTSTCNEIWVAAGVYKPTSGSDRTVSFNVQPGTAVYGGFAGNEANLADRDFQANLTVLSGDIDGDDCGGSGCPDGVDTDFSQLAGNNSYHVVVMDGTTVAGIIDNQTVLDGFTITAGDSDFSQNGAGLYCNAIATGSKCSPTLTELIFSGNRANEGAGIFDYGGFSAGSGVSSPTLTSVTFKGNRAHFGAAMYNYGGGTSSPLLTNVTFSGNNADTAGGAMLNYESEGTSSPTLVNVTFSGNSGIAMINTTGTNIGAISPTLTNVTFSNNSGDHGGAIYIDNHYGAVSTPTLSNVILWGDDAGTGTEIYNVGANPTIKNSIVQGSGGSGMMNWDSSFGTDGGGNLDADPLLGPLQENGGPTRTLMPALGSPAIDAGDSSLSVCPTTDQRGIGRPQGPKCDIGAVERQSVEDYIFNNGFDPD